MVDNGIPGVFRILNKPAIYPISFLYLLTGWVDVLAQTTGRKGGRQYKTTGATLNIWK
jgi:hypothetical protein